LTCPSRTNASTAGANGCYALKVAGQDPKRGIRIDAQGNTFFYGNPAAFAAPAPCTASPCPLSVLGGGATQLAGPTFKRMDFSTFKEMQLSERFRLQFRAEIFNLFNHPNFNAPGFGGNGVVAISGSTDFTNVNNFGRVGSTRDAPYDPRQIQFALKLYY
jgi:hypothetical protein